MTLSLIPAEQLASTKIKNYEEYEIGSDSKDNSKEENNFTMNDSKDQIL